MNSKQTRAQSLFLALGALERPGAQLQIPAAHTPKKYLTLQKEQLELLVAIWAYSSGIKHNKNKSKNQNNSHKS